LHTVKQEQSLNEILPLMIGQDVNQLPVLQDDRLVGAVSREDIERFVEIRRSLGLERESTT
jgi:predicted transcriptional regulator